MLQPLFLKTIRVDVISEKRSKLEVSSVKDDVKSLTPSEKQKRKDEAAMEIQRESVRKLKWQSYLTFVDEKVSKILIKAATTRYYTLST